MVKPINNLESLPKTADIHMWADYIELLCLVNLDGTISKADIMDRVRERKDLGGETDEIETEMTETTFADTDPSPAELDDAWSIRADDWFRHLEYRSKTFGEWYPFDLSMDDKVLSRKSEMSSRHKLYIFLLLVSDLRRIKRSTNFLTDSFEVVSFLALKNCLPEFAEVHIFSRNALRTSIFRGNIWRKLNVLADSIGEKVQVAEDEFSSKDNADKGLDLVGWVPTGDKSDGMLLVFGQCACTTEWTGKQYTSSWLHWKSYMKLKAPLSNMVFIPFCFRRSDGTWCKDSEIHASILIDRPRLLYLLKAVDFPYVESLPHHAFVEEVLTQRDALF